MSTTLNIQSYPPTENGLSLTTNAVAWTYTDWKPLAKCISTDIQIIGLTYQFTFVMTADTTYEYLFEIGVHAGAGVVTKIQIPGSERNDTAVGFYMPAQTVFLPEPYPVTAGLSLYVRVAGSASSSKTFNGIKLKYQSSATNKSELRQAVPNNYQFIEASGGWVSERIR